MALYRGTTKLDGGGGGGATYTAGLNIQISPNNVISATDTTYTAGRGIGIENNGINARVGTGLTIGDYQDYSAIKGPCPEGFHIPTYNEVLTLNSMCSTLGTTFSTHLFFPFNIHNITNNGIQESAIRSMYWTCEKSTQDYSATVLHIYGSAQQPATSEMLCSCGIAIRPFKDVTKIPNSSWTTIFDGSNIANNAGVFYNSDLGILSISSDGINRITIADKNVGATQVYHDGDTLSDANRGLYYQFGNNYGFSWNGGYTTSSTKVDTTGYGPGNYYYDDVFITTGNNERWSSVENRNIWGGVTGVVTQTNTILNTGVLSVNGQTGDVIIPTAEESNTKTFYLSSTSDLVNAQAAYEWYLAGKNPILSLDDNVSQKNRVYIIDYYQANVGTEQILHFRSAKSTIRDQDLYGISEVDNIGLQFVCNDGQVTNIYGFAGSGEAGFLNTQYNYPTPYEPQYDGSPATKKYVDEHIVEYTAGEGIAILNGPDYSTMRGPCSEGFHIPTVGEWQSLVLSLNALGIDITNNTGLKTYCKIPASSYRKSSNGEVSQGDVSGYYWTCNAYENGADRSYRFLTSSMSWDGLYGRAAGMNIRPFKDFAVTPDSGWTTLIENSSGGIYRDTTNGLISISNYTGGWITISDKNLGATQVYDINYPLSDATIGYYYQWGNNYGFPTSGNIETSSTQVDTTGYGPGNYYSNNSFVVGYSDWSSVDNKDLRGGVTGVVTHNNEITNTRNVKMFHISDNLDLATAQEAYNWIKAGKCAIVEFGNSGYSYYGQYLLYEIMPSYVKFKRAYVLGISNHTSNSKVGYEILTFSKTGDTISAITASIDNIEVLRTDGYNNDSWAPTYDSHPATKKYVDDRDTYIGASAPTLNLVEGRLRYDTTNDQLKVYDGTNWHIVDTDIDTTYTAGDGISILDGSAMRGPAPRGYHVPSINEWTGLCQIITNVFSLPSTGETMKTYFKMPYAGGRDSETGNSLDQGEYAIYWSSTGYDSGGLNAQAYRIDFYEYGLYPSNVRPCPNGYSLRCFKDIPVIPDSDWIILYDGSSIATGAGIFYNSSLGLISISGDGTTWATMSDKNLGATQVYNSGDTLSQDNCGGYFQWGNNYMFPWTGSVTTSSTKVDASNYGPGNYYSSDTFITGWDCWDTSRNINLWGGVTGAVIWNNAITNTGVLSVNGQTGDVTVQGALNYYSEGTNTANIAVRSGTDQGSIGVTPTGVLIQEWDTNGQSDIQMYGTNMNILNTDGVNRTELTITPTEATIVTPNKIYTFDNNSATGVARLSDIPAGPTTLQVTLTTAGWSSSTQTVTATGVTSSNTVIVSPDPSGISDYVTGGVYCSAQGTDSLTFTCSTAPSNDITVNVVILN